MIIVLILSLTWACKKERIGESEEYIGEWACLEPVTFEGDRLFAPHLSVAASGHAECRMGMDDYEGRFGKREAKFYIGSKGFPVVMEPEELYWLEYLYGRSLRLMHGSHMMKYIEKRSRDLEYTMVSMQYADHGVKEFLKDIEGTWHGESVNSSVTLVISPDEGALLQGAVRLGQDTAKKTFGFSETTDQRFLVDSSSTQWAVYQKGRVLHLAYMWRDLRLEKLNTDELEIGFKEFVIDDKVIDDKVIVRRTN